MNATDDCLARIRREELVRVAGRLASGTRLLEIGGGNGWQARLLADMGCEVSSIDVDPVGTWNTRHFPVLHYDGTHIPFGDGEFDRVFSSNVLEHVQDVAALLRDTRRVLKPGGIAVHIVPSPAWRFWTSLTHYPYVGQVLLGGGAARGADAAQAVEAAVAKRGWRYLIGRALFDGPHGISPSAIHELAHFSRRRWRSAFENAGFKVREDFPVGLFYTGHMLFARLSMNSRSAMSRVLGSACRAFVLER